MVFQFRICRRGWLLQVRGLYGDPPNLSAPNYKTDLRQGVAMEYVSCEPAESAHELFGEDSAPGEEE